MRIAAVALLILGSLLTPELSLDDSPNTTVPARHDFYTKLPMSFEANDGQSDPGVQFLARSSGYNVLLSSDQAALVLAGAVPESSRVLRMGLRNANTHARVRGEEALPGKNNYFIGNDPTQWRTNISTYAKVRYSEVYPGIDLVYYGNGRELEYDFVVAPGADPGAIRFSFEGNTSASIDRQGDLVLTTGTGGEKVLLRKPVVYQVVRGSRLEVAGGFALSDAGEVSFKLGHYDADETLVIDPILSYSTFFGTDLNEYPASIAVDSSGNTYITGYTLNGPLRVFSPPQVYQIFVAKLNASGSALLYSTYFAAGYRGMGIAADSSGNAYVTGVTSSPNFPTVNAFQPALGSGDWPDAFVLKLNATGSALLYSTYLGGSGFDEGHGIAVDSSGNAYVTGNTSSTNFPTENPLQPASGGSVDVFVTKLNASGSALVYSTYLGGSLYDAGQSIAVDNSGNSYVTGSTSSINFPALNPLQSYSGSGDVFVTKVNAAGSNLVYSTYLGGSGGQEGHGITVDSSGNAYVTGYTFSTNFPIANPIQSASGGGKDGFVTKLNAMGSALIYSTYLGGSGAEEGRGIAVDSSGNAYVTGYTSSTNFPTANPTQSASGGGEDVFVTEVSATGSTLIYSTYLGGNGSYLQTELDEVGTGIAVDTLGNVYLTGSTGSGNFPTANPFQPDYAGGNTYGQDGFITKILRADVTDTTPPAISAVNVSAITAIVATINWTTDEVSDSLVEYGTATTYGNTTSPNATARISHSVNLTALSPNTTYHFRVKSRDASGNLATGADTTFVTSSNVTSFAISNLGSVTRISDGSGDLTVGYGRIHADAGSTTPSGVAIFGNRLNGVLVSEAGVPDAPSISSGIVYVEISTDGKVNTGLAIANPYTRIATINFVFRDTNGTTLSSGSTSIGPNGQIAAFLDSAPFYGGRGIQGTFNFSSNVPVAAIALRSFLNERTPSEFLMTTLPVLAPLSPRLAMQVVPHFAVGGGYTTEIILVNTDNLDQFGTLEFLSASGAPLSVSIDGAPPGTSASYLVKYGGSQRLVITAASTTLAGGSFRIVPSSPGNSTPTPMAIFRYKPGPFTLSEVSVPATTGTQFRMYVESLPGARISSGIAIANATAVAGTVWLDLARLDGSSVATSEAIPLPASGRIVGYLDQFFPSLASQALQGVLRVTTTASSISVVGLRLRYNERDDFIMTSTPPTIENSALSSADRFFPHFANGGGYTTQFILYSGRGLQTSTGTLTFTLPDGTALDLPAK